MIRWSRQYDTDTLVSGFQPLSTTQKWYKNEQVDQLVIKGRQTLDMKERDKVYQDLYKALVEDPGYVFLHAQDNVWGKRASSNWEFSNFGGNTSLTLFYQ
jgi:peptide/nickel transport system substrate-binding protein